jgi:rRNA maturation RNase YbeY
MSIEVNIFDEGEFGFIPEAQSKDIVNAILSDYGKSVATINLIYVDDKEIHRVNLEFLNHDYPTDAITFVIEEESTEADIFIGVEEAVRNSVEYGVTREAELLRLVAHGMLHVMGLDDGTDEEREAMHQLENKYLDLVDEK